MIISYGNLNVEKGSVTYKMANRVEGYYHGTGDVFGSALCAGASQGTLGGLRPDRVGLPRFSIAQD